MRNTLLAIGAALLAAPAMAAVVPQHHQVTRIQGGANFSASHKDASARGSGVRNEVRNSTGVIRAGTQIQGNTTITASQSGATAVASGQGNVAANEAGVIGGR
ncbi:MAG TPA: hypothetical protein VJ576_05295 [Rhodocyclaceae bacterium]|nr:hypothetical protein [Rhodocyclaceae bacterium]